MMSPGSRRSLAIRALAELKGGSGSDGDGVEEEAAAGLLGVSGASPEPSSPYSRRSERVGRGCRTEPEDDTGVGAAVDSPATVCASSVDSRPQSSRGSYCSGRVSPRGMTPTSTRPAGRTLLQGGGYHQSSHLQSGFAALLKPRAAGAAPGATPSRFNTGRQQAEDLAKRHQLSPWDGPDSPQRRMLPMHQA